ncbi:YopJ family acetyltransferase [Xanthomonas euvesicatoria]|uniref:YopJ family acetyltransferase n=1 Tax=Xanthomonas euvesicatoria TaxID=456327 RepID=UPI001C448F4E|nr:YopJ family acetyltransferase [Xanthomonas euvesicatoria]MBV6806986.1 hypothetical protein [Xanthomonas campestris pv. convolvuli]
MGLCNSKPSVAGSPEYYATHTTEQAAPSESPLSSHRESPFSSISALREALPSPPRRSASLEPQGSPSWQGAGWSGHEGFSSWSECQGNFYDSAHEWQGVSTGEYPIAPADMRSQPAWNSYASFDTGAASSHPQALQERAQDSRTSQPVTEAINALRQIKARFAALLDGNWTPGEEEKIFDAVVIPTLIAAESARKPGSPLTLLDTSKELGQWLRKSIPASGKRAVAVLPGYEEHAVAVDVRIIGGRRSVLIIDPLGTDPDRVAQYRQDVLPALKEMLPSKAKTTLLCLSTQKAQTGCKIFALSATSKAADQQTLMDDLHHRNVNGDAFEDWSGNEIPIAAVGDGGIRMIDGKPLLPAQFFKHSQSSGTLGQWAEANQPGSAAAAINTRGETIGDRYSRHASERHPWPFVILEMDQRGLRGTVDPKVIEPRRLSTSLEQKRLVYLQRAIDFLRVASKDESRQFVKRLERFHLKETDMSTPNLRSQPWGPDPYTL